jgi:hypothetical protein
VKPQFRVSLGVVDLNVKTEEILKLINFLALRALKSNVKKLGVNS